MGLCGGDAQAQQRRLAEKLPPTTALDWFLAGQERWFEGDVTGAMKSFDRALAMRVHQIRTSPRSPTSPSSTPTWITSL